MNETKDDLKREKVRIVPISNIEDFPDHPFQVKDDESMDQLVESIRMNGVGDDMVFDADKSSTPVVEDGTVFKKVNQLAN